MKRLVENDPRKRDTGHPPARSPARGSGGGGVGRRRRSEDFRGRREYDGDEVEAAKLFLTGDDGVAVVLGFEELEREREQLSGVNEVRKGRGVFIATVKNCSPKDFGTNMPLPFLLHATCVTHVLCR